MYHDCIRSCYPMSSQQETFFFGLSAGSIYRPAAHCQHEYARAHNASLIRGNKNATDYVARRCRNQGDPIRFEVLVFAVINRDSIFLCSPLWLTGCRALVMPQLLDVDFNKPRITRIFQMISAQTEKCMGGPSALKQWILQVLAVQWCRSPMTLCMDGFVQPRKDPKGGMGTLCIALI